MILTATVTEQGILRILSPYLKPGDEVVIETSDAGIRNPDEGKWSDIMKVLEEIDALDFPRRTHEEIIHDLHELRG